MTRRYRTATSKERNLAALPVIGLGAILVAAVLYLYLDTRAAPPEVLLLTLPGLALTAGGWYFFAAKRDWLTVDFASRQATFVASGQKRWSAPLDQIVPLAVTTVRRNLPNSEEQGAYRTEYRVVTSGARSVPVHAAWTYRKARRAADALARQWRVALCPLDGHVREFSELDQSLSAARLKTFNPPRTDPVPLPAESGVHIEEQSGRAVVRSTTRHAGELPNVLGLAAAGMAGLAASERNILAVRLDPAGDPGETALVAALLLATLIPLGVFLYQAWRALMPAEITIDRQRVTYRGLSVPTAQVVEVVSADAIYVFTPRAALAVPQGFCDPRFNGSLINELRRVIAEKGRRI